MATRCQYESSNEIGVFSSLTNSYALAAIGGSENYYSVLEAELADHIPVVSGSSSGFVVVSSFAILRPFIFLFHRSNAMHMQ